MQSGLAKTLGCFKLLRQELLDLRKKYQSDPDIKISRWATEEEVGILTFLVETNNVKRVFESGTANGWTASAFAFALPEGSSVYTYDPIDRPKIYNDLAIKSKILYFNEKFFDCGNILPAMTSKVTLFFIDGDHSNSGVQEDYATIAPHLKDKDLVVFHDMNINAVIRQVGRIGGKNSSWELKVYPTRHRLAVFKCNITS